MGQVIPETMAGNVCYPLALLVSYRDVIKSSLEVEATGGGVIISVCFELHASVSEDWCVISPGGLREVHVT